MWHPLTLSKIAGPSTGPAAPKLLLPASCDGPHFLGVGKVQLTFQTVPSQARARFHTQEQHSGPASKSRSGGLTNEDLRVLHIGDLNLAGVVQQVHSAVLQVFQDNALPAHDETSSNAERSI